jgi:alpha-tubulin suppressor-like RCC1 family protein
LYKPTKNSWLRNENGVLLGGEGVKLVAVAAGGIRSAVLDEDGTVSYNLRPFTI